MIHPCSYFCFAIISNQARSIRDLSSRCDEEVKVSKLLKKEVRPDFQELRRLTIHKLWSLNCLSGYSVQRVKAFRSKGKTLAEFLEDLNRRYARAKHELSKEVGVHNGSLKPTQHFLFMVITCLTPMFSILDLNYRRGQPEGLRHHSEERLAGRRELREYLPANMGLHLNRHHEEAGGQGSTNPNLPAILREPSGNICRPSSRREMTTLPLFLMPLKMY